MKVLRFEPVAWAQPRFLSREVLTRMTVALSAGRVAATLLSAAWFVVAARSLDVGAFGDLALLLALAMIFGVVADMGYPLLVTGEVASDPSVARSVFRRVVGVRLRLAALASAGLVGAFGVAGRSSPWLAAAFGLSVAATTVSSTAAAALRGLGDVRAEAISEAGSRGLVLVAGGLWVAADGGLAAAVVVYVLADLASAAYLTGALAATAPAARHVDYATVGLRRTLPLAAATVVATIYYRVDVWMLALLNEPRQVAFYAAAYRVLEALLLPSSAVGAVSVAGSAQPDASGTHRRLLRLTAFGLLLSLPAAAAVAPIASPLLGAVFGSAYAEGGNVLRVLLLSLPASVVIGVVGPWSTLTYRWRITAALGSCLTANVALNAVLIPAFGATAAAATTALTQWLLLAMVWAVARRVAR